jgi:hypothetical protein
MRLPWIQVADEAFERGVELAALLDVPEAQAVGHLALLWRWALSRPSDEKLDGIVSGDRAVASIEAGARWTGQRGALVDALVEVGLVGASRNGDHYRVKGLERYRATIKQRTAEAARLKDYRAQKKAAKATAPYVVRAVVP